MFSSLVGMPVHGSSGKSHKHGSSHGSRRSTTTTSHTKAPKTSKSQRSVVPGTVPSSFLFVVNELQVDYEPLPGDDRPLTDQWFNTLPPQQAGAYIGEMVGTVFRYQNGVVSTAHGYLWHRPATGLQGRIVRINQAGVIDGYPAVYRDQTVFACSPLLPMIVTDGDASLGYSFLRRICSCDRRYDEQYSTWSYLHFGGGADGQGVSYVYSGASGDPYVAGRDASWIPSLVPSAYKNTDPSAPSSNGLSGHLSIILALMGFHGKPGRASDVFQNGKWNLGEWRGSGRASSYLPKSGESPRGLFVQVCADNLVEGQADNEENNVPTVVWEEIMQNLECRTILVQG